MPIHSAVIPLYFKKPEHFHGCSETDSINALSPLEMFCTEKESGRGETRRTRFLFPSHFSSKYNKQVY